MEKIRVTIWNEFRHEKSSAAVAEVYPEGLHRTIGKYLEADDLEIRYASLDEPDHGLSDEVINSTDVMIWWGHIAHGEVRDDIVEKVHKRVLEGMGMIILHSGHFSKIFRRLMGTTCALKWREVGEFERLWNIAPYHPIAQGIGEYFEIPHEEMYGERFDIPEDGKIIFISNFEGGNVFRSGVAFDRGYGKVFYFQPGHETYPTYHQKEVIQVISNAVRWAKPVFIREITAPNYPPLDEVKSQYDGVKLGVVQDVDGINK